MRPPLDGRAITTLGRQLVGPLAPSRVSPPTRQGLLRGIMAFRWLTLVWVVAVFAWEVDQRNRARVVEPPVEHPFVGFTLLGIVFVGFVALSVLYRRDPNRLVRPAPILIELIGMAVLLLADVWVYGFDDHAQSLPSVSVLAAILTTAIAGGRRPAIAAGFGLGLARYVGWLPFADGRVVSVQRVASWVLLMVTGWTAGYILVRLAAADRSIATFRAREEVARTLHDGVLQTLAVVQRRSDDAELVELARTQELELREYLFGSGPDPADGEPDLAGGLRSVARRAEQRHGLRVEVITAPDLPGGDERGIVAVCGAVGEALTNAAKHGEADRVVVYAEPTEDRVAAGPIGPGTRPGRDEVFVSVKDDGGGFDPAETRERHGLGHSIRGRIDEIGGRVEVDGRPGRGAEIRIWAPTRGG